MAPNPVDTELEHNQVVEFEMSIEQLNLMRNETERMIWKAINDGRVRVVFQPVVCAKSLQTISLEALVRIESETGEMISPMVFTESTAMEDLQIAFKLMEQLRSAGALFSLDDFGTGYASLGSLSDLPLDVVKLDRSFITGITDKPVSQAIVLAVVDIASHCGLTVTAEGVETQAQCQMVQELNVTHIQGFSFSRPLTEADTLKWLTNKP